MTIQVPISPKLIVKGLLAGQVEIHLRHVIPESWKKDSITSCSAKFVHDRAKTNNNFFIANHDHWDVMRESVYKICCKWGQKGQGTSIHWL